jgi:hypothetical protein
MVVNGLDSLGGDSGAGDFLALLVLVLVPVAVLVLVLASWVLALWVQVFDLAFAVDTEEGFDAVVDRLPL